jgi:hypothetical protein
MLKSRGLLLLVLGSVMLTGCFEVIEEVTYKNTESGTYLLTMNCSQSKSRLKALAKLDTFMGLDIPTIDQVSSYTDKALAAVRTVKGVSAADYQFDTENFIIRFSFEFDKTETLNAAINAAAKSVTEKSSLPYYNVFASSANGFERHQTPNDSISALIRAEKDKLKLIAGARATSIYRFPRTVKKTGNAKAMISRNGKAVMLKQNVSDIMLDPSLFTNTITF